MKTICFIPARGGSVRIPRKNIRMFHGKPIIAHSIESAKKTGLFGEIIVSTDDDEIDRLSGKLGATVTRRPADDGSTGTQELAGAYLRNRPDVGICCVLYATAALLTWRDIVAGWQCLNEPRHFSGPAFAHSCLGYTIDDIGGFYWGWAQAFREGIPLEGNSRFVPIQPQHCCDINTEADFQRAERMYEEMHRGN